MYRESLAGLALAATLEELDATLGLTEAQKESLWQVLDRTMEQCLAEAPVMSRIMVTCPPPSVEDLLPPDSGSSRAVHIGSSGLGRSDGETGGTAMHSGDAAAAARSADCEMAFPVYRRVDDMWTILLKNPTVNVRDEFGAEERFQLDYLKVYLKDPTSASEPKRKKVRR